MWVINRTGIRTRANGLENLSDVRDGMVSMGQCGFLSNVGTLVVAQRMGTGQRSHSLEASKNG